MQVRGHLVLGGMFAVLALLVAGVWLVPSMLDWNRYRDGIAALASEELGRPVHIGGAVTLQLLPQPILTASDVSVEAGLADEHGQVIGADAIGLRAKALRLRVALGPLLAGKVDARELTLQGADLRLPWPPPPGALAQRPPSWLTGLQAQIEDGRLQVGDLVLTGIDGTVTTDPDTGTLAAAGVWESGTADAMRRWRFTARLGRPGRDGSAALDMTLDGQDALRDTGGSFSGQIGSDGALSGRIAGRGPDLSVLMPAPALPWRSDGRLNASGGLAIADELALEIGGAPARGAVALRVQPKAQLDVAITAGRLDLDAWLPALLSARSGGGAPRSLWPSIPTGIDLSAEAATLAGGTVRHLRGGVDLADGVVRLRDVTAILPGDASIEMTGQVSTVPVVDVRNPGTTVSATAGGAPNGGAGGAPPGGAPLVKADAAASVRDQVATRAHFNGAVSVKAPDLRTTLRWLQRGVPKGPGDGLLAAAAGLPGGVLYAASLSGQVSADAGAASVTGLQGQLDESRIGGNASMQFGARLGLSATMTLDNAVLDGWLPDPAILRAAVLDPATVSGTIQAALGQLRAVDADLSLVMDRAAWHGVPVGPVALELQSDASHVALKRLDLQPMGADLSVSGQVGDTGRLSDGRLELSVPDLATIKPALAQTAPAFVPLLVGKGRLQVLAAGPPDAVGMRAVLDIGDLRLEAQPVVNLATRRWAGTLTLHHPGAPRLLDSLGVAGTASWLGDGSLSLLGQATWTPGRFELQGATLSAGSLRSSGQVVFEGRRLFGTLSFDVLPLPLIGMHSADPLPVAWLRDWQAALRIEATQIQVGPVQPGGSPLLSGASADLTLNGGVLTVARAVGRLDGGMATGEATLDAAADPPRVSVRLQATELALAVPVFGTPVDIVAGHGDVSATLSAAGYSPVALLATLSGSGSLRVHDGLVSGFDLAAAGHALGLADGAQVTAQVRAALTTGNSSFDTLEAPVTIAGGVVNATADLGSAAGGGTMTGSVDLQNAGVDLRLALTPVVAGSASGPAAVPARAAAPSAGPVLGLRISGPANALIRTPELAALTRWLADRMP
jgi:hypothetical protein